MLLLSICSLQPHLETTQDPGFKELLLLRSRQLPGWTGLLSLLIPAKLVTVKLSQKHIETTSASLRTKKRMKTRAGFKLNTCRANTVLSTSMCFTLLNRIMLQTHICLLFAMKIVTGICLHLFAENNKCNAKYQTVRERDGDKIA